MPRPYPAHPVRPARTSPPASSIARATVAHIALGRAPSADRGPVAPARDRPRLSLFHVFDHFADLPREAPAKTGASLEESIAVWANEGGHFR